MRRTITTLGLTAVTVMAMATAAAAQSSASYTAQLDGLNDSGASGTAMVQVNGDEVTVTVETSGASAEAPHAQHIHVGGTNTCPTMENDDNDDGVVSTPEGGAAYGGIKISLTTEGDTSADSALAVDRFPTANGDGVVSYERTFTLPDGVTADDVANGVIVQHGVANSSLGEDDAAYDGPDSPLAEGVPQEVTLPNVCGSLQAAPAGGVATGGGGMADTSGTSSGIGLAALALFGIMGVGLVTRRRATNHEG